MARARGFTLIEVLVAITLLGLSYAALLNAFSGSLRLARSAAELQNAVLLARAKLDETAVGPSLTLADEPGEETWGGVAYAYKIEIRPVTVVEKELADTVRLPVRLEEIAVEVYWGKGATARSVRLARYALTPAAPPS